MLRVRVESVAEVSPSPMLWRNNTPAYFCLFDGLFFNICHWFVLNVSTVTVAKHFSLWFVCLKQIISLWLDVDRPTVVCSFSWAIKDFPGASAVPVKCVRARYDCSRITLTLTAAELLADPGVRCGGFGDSFLHHTVPPGLNLQTFSPGKTSSCLISTKYIDWSQIIPGSFKI